MSINMNSPLNKYIEPFLITSALVIIFIAASHLMQTKIMVTSTHWA